MHCCTVPCLQVVHASAPLAPPPATVKQLPSREALKIGEGVYASSATTSDTFNERQYSMKKSFFAIRSLNLVLVKIPERPNPPRMPALRVVEAHFAICAALPP